MINGLMVLVCAAAMLGWVLAGIAFVASLVAGIALVASLASFQDKKFLRSVGSR